MRIMFLNHSFRREENEDKIMALLQTYASEGTILELHYPEDLGGGKIVQQLQQNKAPSGLHHILETPALVKKIIEAERSGFDAVVQSNTFDPGVEAGRLAVRIPVVGVLRSSCHFAASLCDRFGLIPPLESYIPYVSRMMDTYRMSPFISGIKAIGLYESGDVSRYHDAILERTIAVGRELVAGGAQVLIPLGGRLIPYAVRPEELEAQVGVPVINTKAVGIRFAELMVTGKMSHSLKAYPFLSGLRPEDVKGTSGPQK
jgi:allantoin racemase